MGVYNEQGAALEAEKESKRGPSRRCRTATPTFLRRQVSKARPKDVLPDMMFEVGGWTKDDPSYLVEQFCPEYNEWRTAARLVNSRGMWLWANWMARSTQYKPDIVSWCTDVAPLSSPRSGVCLVAMDGHLYAIGGRDGTVSLNTVERENAGCAVFWGHIYVAGGKDELKLELCSNERFDPDNMKWTPVKRMRSKRDDMSLAVFNGSLLAVGGSDGITSLKKIEVYCHETNPCRHFGSMKSNHPGGRAAVLF